MVARISTGESLYSALRYNEQKVEHGDAILLMGAHFGCDVDTLSMREKMNRFDMLTRLNTRTTHNAMHISLSFSKEEFISEEKMQQIAGQYMDGIGFGNQPYLVYTHTDTGNQHLHIVSTNIQDNGRAIPLFNIGKGRSEDTRKAIEEAFGLVKAEGRRNAKEFGEIAEDILDPLLYTEGQIKAKITNIVRRVMTGFAFTSFEDFNATLRQFNVTATLTPLGNNGKQGLVYHAVDQNGVRQGNAINASDIYTSPTFAKITGKAHKNVIRKTKAGSYVKRSIANILAASTGRADFIDRLKNIGWHCTTQYQDGQISDLCFVNKGTGQVYNTQDFQVSAVDIASYLSHKEEANPLSLPNYRASAMPAASIDNFLYHLFKDEYIGPDISAEFFKSGNKKKKKRKS